jgi:hypothetical protein
MNKTINVVELASELAHERMKMELELSDDQVWVDSDDTLVYTEEAQDTFNEWYDYYYTLIEQL